ncbi:MAG: hypothetical protein M3N06_02755 [Pseudomonadota bacterium]|nr:hypothetical protein [Pseudomonadota bacterium]
MGQARQPGLDVVRGTAILLVLLFHGCLPLGVPALDAVVQPLFAVGWIGDAALGSPRRSPAP